ncbi:beta-1,4-glucuronyltransferase 1-like [Tigriopus californicus]|uniref:beta-1,4-glucuronyltransferase 1-like n=1 Tax=Tigriopus californicus TaxID=6832 RepID=UPI0027DA01D3|nr:beta-1,4-glucuronyltransferase 1-like [Tigriopus californicus]
MWLFWVEEVSKPHRWIILLLIPLAIYLWIPLRSGKLFSNQNHCQGVAPQALQRFYGGLTKRTNLTSNGTSKAGRRFHASSKFHLNKNLTCFDRDTSSNVFRRGRYWVFQNYLPAHQRFHCNETITYTTHADPTFFNNLEPLLERWQGPISLSVYAPGTDFKKAVKAILYLRECSHSNLVKNFVTFHLFFEYIFLPPIGEKIIQPQDILKIPVRCDNFTATEMLPVKEKLFKNKHKLKYPVNMARNLAREFATTYFVFPCDIELYPNPGLIGHFLDMIKRNDSILKPSIHQVFPISVFEIQLGQALPKTKRQLLKLYSKGLVQLFHAEICESCHKIPHWNDWMNDSISTEMAVFTIGKRLGSLKSWEPFYIGTHSDPLFDERLNWDGRRDKMTQGFVLCLKGYEFHVLNNAFLVHKPGVKTKDMSLAERNDTAVVEQNALIFDKIVPELKAIHGARAGCSL